MPELPEVETTRRGIEPALVGQRFSGARVRNPALRWPVPADLGQQLRGQTVRSVERRAKYLLIPLDTGTVILHLGMSGRLRVLSASIPPEKHEHVDLLLDNGQALRLHDTRRFGAVLWTPRPWAEHPLIARLGPEPLAPEFDPDLLWRKARGRQLAIKSLIMDGQVVVGVGNIYANEALFRAGIHPRRAAGRISRKRLAGLVGAIKSVLGEALARGGTTLRDYRGPDGARGYFTLDLRVYDQAGQPCPSCQTAVRREVLGQRATYFCPACQR